MAESRFYYSGTSTKIQDLIKKIKNNKALVAEWQSGIEEYKVEIKKLRDPTSSEHDKEDKIMKYEEWIRSNKCLIASHEDEIIKWDQELGGRGKRVNYTSVVYSGKRKTEINKLMERSTSRKESLSLVAGGGGVGKTHFITMALELEPPSIRVSTPCAKMPLYTTKNYQVAKNNIEDLPTYKVLTDEMHTQMMIKSGQESTSSISWRRRFSNFLKNLVRVSNRTISEVDKHFCRIEYVGVDDVESLDGMVLVRIIDIGGQPQFLELLPRFIIGISVGIIVIDVSQDLTDYPIVYFYGEDGKPVGEGVRSNLTNEHFFRLFLQMIASQSMSRNNIRVVIVGTHRDVEHKSKESRESKEGKLKEIIASFHLEKNIVYTDETYSHVIFAVNAKTPEIEDRVISRKIMEVIMDEKQAENIRIPLKHHKLELTLKEMAHSDKVAISFKEVFNQISDHYNNHEEMKDGLIFLKNAFRIFYFKEFPNLVFGEPQLLLNFMTEIAVRHMKLATNPGNEHLSAVWKYFKEQGLVNEFVLKEIGNVFDEFLTPGIMLEVLEVLLVIFKVNHGEYIMPSLLTATKALPFTSSHSISMLLYFPLGLARFGIYCSTVCKVASSSGWKLYHRCHVHRNSFQFVLPNGHGIVTLNDSFDSFFQVVLDVPPQLPVKISSICSEVRDTLTRVINEVTQELRYTPDQPVLAFLCNHHHNSAMPPHPTKYIQDGGYLHCTKDATVITAEVTDIQRHWLRDDEVSPTLCSVNSVTLPLNPNTRKSVQNSALDTSEPGAVKHHSTLSHTKSHPESHYQHYVENISEDKHTKLQYEINSDHHIRRLAEKLTGWEEKYDLFHLDRHAFHAIQHGANKFRPKLQQIDLLHTWKTKCSPDATYDCLLKVLLVGGFTDCAIEMVDILNED